MKVGDKYKIKRKSIVILGSGNLNYIYGFLTTRIFSSDTTKEKYNEWIIIKKKLKIDLWQVDPFSDYNEENIIKNKSFELTTKEISDNYDKVY